jgi:hypothetical protein
MYLALVASLFLSSSALTIERLDEKSNFLYNDTTTKGCTWWVDYDGTQDCVQLLGKNLTTLMSFLAGYIVFELNEL